MQKLSINSLADVRLGIHVIPDEEGDLAYLQLRQFDMLGKYINTSAEFIKSTIQFKSSILNDGDVLFVGKGSRLFAWCYHDDYGPAVASSNFLILRPKSDMINPDYLAAVLNMSHIKSGLQQLGGGSNIFSLRKSEVEAYQIPIPSLHKQKQIVALTDLHNQEVTIAQQLIEQKQTLYKAIITKLTK